MSKLLKYKIWCDTDSKWEETDFIEEEKGIPTLCPSNIAHAIDDDKTTQIGSIETTETTIREEKTPEGDIDTGHSYQGCTKKFDVPATEGWHDFDFSFPYPISLFSAGFADKLTSIGDIAKFSIGPDTTTGVLTAAIAVNDTVINVSSTVIAYAKVGRHMKFVDGTNPDLDMGRIKAIDSVNNTLEFENGAANIIASGGDAKMTVYMVPEFHLGYSDLRINLGEDVIGGSYIKANTVMRLSYYNSAASAETFVMVLQYKY